MVLQDGWGGRPMCHKLPPKPTWWVMPSGRCIARDPRPSLATLQDRETFWEISTFQYVCMYIRTSSIYIKKGSTSSSQDKATSLSSLHARVSHRNLATRLRYPHARASAKSCDVQNASLNRGNPLYLHTYYMHSGEGGPVARLASYPSMPLRNSSRQPLTTMRCVYYLHICTDTE